MKNILHRILIAASLVLSSCSGLKLPELPPEEIFDEVTETIDGALHPDDADQDEVTSVPGDDAAFVLRAALAKYKGQDILGLAMQDAGMIAQTIQPNTAIGFLDYTFGDPWPNFKKLTDTGKVSAFRVHCSNGPCARNKNCAKDEPKANDLKSLRKCAANAQRVNNLTGIPCYVSPRVEHDEKNKSLVDSWVKNIKEVAPNCPVVISAFTGYTPAGVLPEKHGNKAKGSITSNDGASIFDSNSGEYIAGATLMCLAWTNRDNIRVSGEKTFTTPKKRPKTMRLTKNELIQKIRLLEPSSATPANPAFCKNAEPVKGPDIYKPNAEDYANGDKRGGRPMLISKTNVSKFDVYNPAGKKIACFKKYGTYSGGGFRYYEGDCSGLHAVELEDKAKSQWIYLKSGSKCFRVNAVRRSGTYR